MCYNQGMHNLDESQFSKELLKDPKVLAVTTGTFYPKWYPGPVTDKTSDKIRGDLALKTLALARAQGYQIAVIEGGSSTEFQEALRSAGIAFSTEKKRGMSSGRRQIFKEASELPGVKVIFWLEPEKTSLINPETLAKAADPILRNEADIVMPSRDKSAFDSYPPYQAESEQRANAQYNKVLRVSGLLQADDSDLDFFFGVRLFANRPKLTEYFQRVYEFEGNPKLKLHQSVRPDNYSNSNYLPIVQALIDGLKVKSVPVDYVHPPEQTAMENNNPAFDGKRVEQRHDIVTTLIHFIRNRLNQASRMRGK